MTGAEKGGLNYSASALARFHLPTCFLLLHSLFILQHYITLFCSHLNTIKYQPVNFVFARNFNILQTVSAQKQTSERRQWKLSVRSELLVRKKWFLNVLLSFGNDADNEECPSFRSKRKQHFGKTAKNTNTRNVLFVTYFTCWRLNELKEAEKLLENNMTHIIGQVKVRFYDLWGCLPQQSFYYKESL